jgi:formate dehydrogenase accessory protein FdhE
LKDATRLNAKIRDTWQRRLQRAEELSAADTASRSLVAFYAALLRVQGELYDHLSTRSNWRPSGALDCDLPTFRSQLPLVLRAVAVAAPEPLAMEARMLLEAGVDTVEQMLLAFWRAPSDRRFFAKAIVQPYAQRLADSAVEPVGRERSRAENRCPFCGGTPQLSMFRGASDSALEGGGRALQCATCLTTWPFRRVLCPHCGEEDERKLGYFHSPAFDHLRLETCDSCRHYLKGVDLTRLGVAVPLVDEVASAPLDVWARDHGYVKIELNLVGL